MKDFSIEIYCHKTADPMKMSVGYNVYHNGKLYGDHIHLPVSDSKERFLEAGKLMFAEGLETKLALIGDVTA